MSHDDWLILCGLDELEAQLERELREQSEQDRLAEFAPASALPSALTPRPDPSGVSCLRGRRQPEDPRPEEPEHRRVRHQLYGLRSGDVSNVVPISAAKRAQTFNYVESDIPAGITLADWRARKNATSGPHRPEAA